MKIKILTLFLVMLSSFNSYCQVGKKMNFETMEKMNLCTAEKILKCISEKDTETLLSLFSEEALNSDLNFEKDIGKVFSYCNGQAYNSEKIVQGVDTKIEGNKNFTEFHNKYHFFINETSFIMSYIYIPKNSFEKSKEGVRTLRIIKEKDKDRYFCYWQDMKPGIFVPEE